MPFFKSLITVISLISIALGDYRYPFNYNARTPDRSISPSTILRRSYSRSPIRARKVNTTSIGDHGSSSASCYFWMEHVEHQGAASFHSNSTYNVFRNVKDFGAKGDGVTDDTAAINAAISSGNRCGPNGCASSTTTPATVYFPSGTYVVSAPIIDYYYTQIIGNPNCLPVIKAGSNFTARWVIDADQYQSNGQLGFGATNVFFRQIANLIIDTTSVAAKVLVAGIHWPTAQATSLQNIAFKLSSVNGTQHEGVFIESGSGGFMADLSFDGGLHGMTVGNQQFTMRDLTFSRAVIAINQLWDWGWTYQSLNIKDCQIGVNMSSVGSTGTLDVGSVVILDSTFSNTPVGISMGRGSNSTPPAGNSIILENVNFHNVRTAVQGPGASSVLSGNIGHVAAWGQGHSYSSNGATGVFQGPIEPNRRPSSLTLRKDFYKKSKPQYAQIKESGFVSVKDQGAAGDGITDDSDALIAVFAKAATSGKIVYMDAGNYLVSKTIYVPSGVKIFGEAYPVILSSGSLFADRTNPKPVLQIGKSGESGRIEISNLIVSGRGAQAGAVFIEYNLASAQGSGLWDVHTRVGGFAGSDLQIAQCAKAADDSTIKPECIAAFMSMHITPSASRVYMENNWLWVADHDIEDPTLRQISLYAGRGLLIESKAGGNWLYGTAVEHHQLYEYNLASTKDIVMGQIQTETAYYQPTPSGPFAVNTSWNDPIHNNPTNGWGLNIKDSDAVLVYGAGHYSFFDSYNVTCSNQGNAEKCQSQILNVEGSSSRVSVYNINTVGTESMVAVNGKSIASWADNKNGFVSTIALFRI